VLSGHFGVVSVCLPGLKDCEDHKDVPVCSRATISADFGQKVPISPCFSLDASDHFSYHSVDILSNADRVTERIVIESLEEEDPEIAEEILKRMFVFEDIVLLDDLTIQKVLREIDSSDLMKALRSVDSEVSEKIFRNMSERARDTIKEEMDFMGPVRIRSVEESQSNIVSVIKKMEEAGEIIIARSGEDEFIV